MEFVVAVAIIVLLIIFVVTLCALVFICLLHLRRKKQPDTKPILRNGNDSTTVMGQNEEYEMREISPNIARIINDNIAWSHDSSGLIEQCLYILHSTRRIFERLTREIGASVDGTGASSSSTAPSTEVRLWTRHLIPSVDALVRSLYIGKSSIPLIEARATALILVLQGLSSASRLSYPKHDLQWLCEATDDLYHHLDLIRNIINNQIMQRQTVEVHVRSDDPDIVYRPTTETIEEERESLIQAGRMPNGKPPVTMSSSAAPAGQGDDGTSSRNSEDTVIDTYAT